VLDDGNQTQENGFIYVSVYASAILFFKSLGGVIWFVLCRLSRFVW